MTSGEPTADRALQRGLAKAIARSWKDDAFRERLLADPHAALSDIGVDVPEGTVIRVVPDDLVELPLPGPETEWDEESATAALARLLSPGT